MALQFCGTCGQPLMSGSLVCQHCDSPVGNPRAALVDLSMDLTPTRQTPVPVPATRQTRHAYLFLGLAGVLVALALIAGGVALLLLRQQPGQPVLTPATASALVQQFYSDVNAQHYSDAYALLSNEWHHQTSLTDFSNGYQNTLNDTLKIEGTQTLADGTIQVNVQLQALEQHADGSRGTTVYAGFYVIGKEDGKLRILRGTLNPQTGT
jgi:Tfp pilus assembly protein FimV